MKHFTELYLRLDQSNATNDKVEALVDYFALADPADSAWAIWFLSGRRLKRLLKRANLKRWALEASEHPEWMLAEAYEAVGDLAETIALLLPEPWNASADDRPLRFWIEERLVPLGAADEDTQGLALKGWWANLSADQRFVLNKLLTGALRVGVSQRLVTRALAQHLSLDQALIAHRLMGDWVPAPGFLDYLKSGDGDFADDSLPYPFFLSAPLEAPAADLGPVQDWQAEWK
ncbi:MAG: ATP-dependent DNA ligase, partial [Pseudomonadota bacterium]